MKKIVVFCLLLSGLFLSAFAQQGDLGTIGVSVFVPQSSPDMSLSVIQNLERKLTLIANKNGMLVGKNQRFVLTAKVDAVSKDITPTAPPMHAYGLEVHIYLGDGIDGKLFASTSVSLKGVGTTEAKAYIAALKMLQPSSPKYDAFLNESKQKIFAYYNDRCDQIIATAQQDVDQRNFDKAMASLSSIPEECTDCKAKANSILSSVYHKKIDDESVQLLLLAQNEWNTTQDEAAAERAGAYLSKIDPNASNYAEVQAFSSKMGEQIKVQNDREWNFQAQQKRDEMKAIRDIGVAYGNNQPKEVYNIVWW